MTMLWDGNLTASESERRNYVIGALLEATRENRTVKLPAFDPEMSVPSPTVASVTVGLEPNPYGGTMGPYRYQFEGEEDLLHVIVTRIDQEPLRVEDAQQVAQALFRGVPPAMIWLKPGHHSQHFFLGHDDLERYVERT